MFFPDLFPVVVFLPDLLHPPPLAVHVLDDPVGGADGQERDGAKHNATVDVRHLRALENILNIIKKREFCLSVKRFFWIHARECFSQLEKNKSL